MWVPEDSTFGAAEECADLARALGDDVDQPEVDLLRVLLAEGPVGSDRWAGLESGVFCGRQNIKTWGLKRSVMYDAWVRDVKRITWSAQLYKTTQEAFNDIAADATNIDWLRKRVKRIRYANGEEGIDFTNGATMDFVARSARAARGLAADTVVLDEALFVTPAMMGALLPTLSTRPKPHVRYGSSPGLFESQVARSVRDRGRAGGDTSLAYIEWTSTREGCLDPECAHSLESEGCQLDDEAKWHQANPALGRRITVEYVRQERRALPPDEFQRERLGWWDDPPDDGAGNVWPLSSWRNCRDGAGQIVDGPVAVALDVSWDRSAAYVSVVGPRADGVPRGLVKHSCEPSRVVRYIVDDLRLERQLIGVALQGTGAQASSLLPDLQRELEPFGIPVHAMTGPDLQRALGIAFDAVVAEKVSHPGQPVLDRGVATATTRVLTDVGSVLDRKHSRTDIAGLVSWVNALWLWQTYIEEAKPKIGLYFG